MLLAVLCFGLILCLIGCNRIGNRAWAASGPSQLPIPANLTISVTGRLMTVTWDPIENATGYIIHTTSEACGSGNRIVNTSTKTVTSHSGSETNSAVSTDPITDRGNGFVTFTGENSFTIWLMPQSGSRTSVMATALIANIIAVGDFVNYTDSEQSNTVRIDKADYLP